MLFINTFKYILYILHTCIFICTYLWLISLSRTRNLEVMFCFVVYVFENLMGIYIWLWAHTYHSTHMDIKGQVLTVGPCLSTLFEAQCLNHASWRDVLAIMENSGLVLSTHIQCLPVTQGPDNLWSLGEHACMYVVHIHTLRYTLANKIKYIFKGKSY